MSKHHKKIWITVIYIVIMIYIMSPFLWTFFSSIKSNKDIYSSVLKFDIGSLTFGRYTALLTGKEAVKTVPGADFKAETANAFRAGLFNSFIVSLCVTILCLSFGSLAAFAFAKLKSKVINTLFIFIIFLRFLPVVILTVPLFVVFSNIGLINTKIGLVLCHTSLVLPLVIWIIKAFFETVPNELLDAARIDGCSQFRLIYMILIPVSIPAFITAGLITFISSWQEFLFALVFTTSNNAKTLPVAMAEFFGRQGFDYGMACTGSVIATLPIVIIAFFAQRYIVKGLMSGAVIG